VKLYTLDSGLTETYSMAVDGRSCGLSTVVRLVTLDCSRKVMNPLCYTTADVVLEIRNIRAHGIT